MEDEPSIFSKQHPTRLLVRAAMLVLVSPFLFYSGVTSLEEDGSRGALGIGAGVLFALIGGWHLYSVWSSRDG